MQKGVCLPGLVAKIKFTESIWGNMLKASLIRRVKTAKNLLTVPIKQVLLTEASVYKQ
ncbi:hypothetical protein EV102420_09_01490 [Pseudescherichia vulneris NBRC 102420]|uniref:Uncharacterized protein n=1 Tax=Pseudescherichia vulneris NBRC 102420 TaxID=1115515 RepID=A0A090VSK3_PSEVU|nr:hypothetical protein EV102420_09_01490 [Pseudescherichia vulneris NBRC 102420]